MKKSIFESLMNVCDQLGREAVKHSPELFAGLGIASFWIGGIWGIKATTNAKEEIEEVYPDGASTKESIKIGWKYYIGPLMCFCVGTGCVISGTKESLRRNAALTAAYAFVENEYRDYKEKTKEIVGKSKEQKIEQAIAEKRLADNKVGANEIIVTGGGNVKCLEAMTGRYFYSDMETIRRSVNDLNNRIFHEMYISLNDFFDAIGLSHTDIGDKLGWNTDNILEIHYGHALDENGVPCLVISYQNPPKYRYDDLH